MDSVKEIRAKKPKQVRWALILSIVALVLWLPVAGSVMATTNMVSLFLLLYPVGAVGAWRGRKGARTLATVMTAGLYFVLLPLIWLGDEAPYITRSGSDYSVIDLLAVLAAGAAVVLWYLPASLDYFDRISAARAAATQSTQPGS